MVNIFLLLLGVGLCGIVVLRKILRDYNTREEDRRHRLEERIAALRKEHLA